VCDCACRVVQTLHFAGQAVVHVHIPVHRCCIWVVTDPRARQARNQRGKIGQLPHTKFSQKYIFVRCSNKLYHFPPPKISVGCGPGARIGRYALCFICFVTIHMVDIACNQTFFSGCYPNIANCLCY